MALVRALFGLVWLVDGYMKFRPGMLKSFYHVIDELVVGRPAWQLPWFRFWREVLDAAPDVWLRVIGVSELLLGCALVLGLLLKPTYVLGFLLALLIWAVPSKFGGPYVAGTTDIGASIVYCFVFVLLMLHARAGSNRCSMDFLIAKRVHWWRRIAEF